MVEERDTLEFQVTATDPDLDPIILTAQPLPTNASFRDNGDGTGDFFFAPDYGQDSLYLITFTASDGLLADSEIVEVTVLPAGAVFIRGDADNTGDVSMGDALFTLRYLYVPGSPAPGCMDAADTDDTGDVSMGDALYTLRYLYVPGSPPPPPPCCDYPGDCGPDPTDDDLDCGVHPCQNVSRTLIDSEAGGDDAGSRVVPRGSTNDTRRGTETR
jgi:hypothetical protein